MTEKQTARRRLPNRRRNTTHDLELDGRRSSVCVGYFEDGTPGETFISGPKIGSEMDSVLQDSAILASLALQYGPDQKKTPSCPTSVDSSVPS